jgi:hypothetical protein
MFWVIVAVLFLSSISQNRCRDALVCVAHRPGVSAGGAAFAVSVMGAASLLGQIALGWLLDRFFAPRVSFWLLGFSALGVSARASDRWLWGRWVQPSLASGWAERHRHHYYFQKCFGLRSFSTLYGFT